MEAAKKIPIETATARDVLAVLFPAHDGPEHTVANAYEEAGNGKVAGPIVLTCACGEALDCSTGARSGWEPTAIAERLKKLQKIDLARVGLAKA